MSDAITTLKVDTPALLGEQIRAQRKALRLTQADAAALCGVGPRFLSDLENGKPTAHVGKAMAVLSGLGLDMHIGPRGQQSIAAAETAARASLPAGARLQQYLAELQQYDLSKLPKLNEQARQLAQQVSDSQQQLSGEALRIAEQIAAAQKSAGQAVKSAAAQIAELQKNQKRLARLSDSSDD